MTAAVEPMAAGRREKDMNGKTAKQRYIIQRLDDDNEWVNFTCEGTVTRVTLDALHDNPADHGIAEAALMEVCKARPYERFRLALKTTAVKQRYIIQRLVYGSFGSLTDKWVGFSYERVCSQATASALRGDPTNQDIAEAALLEVSKGRPYEKFRLALETTTVECDIEPAVGPRRILVPSDIAEFIKGRKVDEMDRESALAIAKDEFRAFNGVVPAMREIHLNPWHFSAYRIPVVQEALRQHANGRFEDKWIPLYPDVDPKRGKEAANHLINLGLQAEIICWVEDFGTRKRVTFVRSDYAGAEQPNQKSYGTLAKAKSGERNELKRQKKD